MRKAAGFIVLIVTLGLVYKMDHPMGKLPALGRILDPVSGCWANAEPVSRDFSFENKFPELHKEAVIWLDERLVPHIKATDNHDLYFLQGYIHASFRLWQMDMQTRAAAGRVSEVAGPGDDDKILNFDRKQRRKGMVYAAENSLKKMEEDVETKVMLDAYTEGINAFLSTLKERDYPLEYKLMGFAPELWTNLKISLLLKYMADDLTGYTEDIPLTYLRDKLPAEQFKLLYPEKNSASSTVIPSGTEFAPASLSPAETPLGDLFPRFTSNKTSSVWNEGKGTTRSAQDISSGIGSNNWAVGGTRAKDGAAILCNDPHLGLNLPSLWFECQLQAPGVNVYGATLPGAPGVVIGFNDSVSWGFTNNYRDVKDFYAIKEIDKGHYSFNGKAMEYQDRVEHIITKGRPDLLDTVHYTVHGPVMYDAHFKEPGGFVSPLALRWKAHDPSNELKAFYLLNRAHTYEAFTEALGYYECPAQNMLYADRKGHVAIWGQGSFVNKWPEQGRYIMNGADSATLWKELIPMVENPHAKDPERGYVFSANECVTDSTYPYWYNGYFYEFRAWRINQVLSALNKATVADMCALQNDNYSWLAAHALPVMLRRLPASSDGQGEKWRKELSVWNFRLEAESKTATFFQVWWYNLYHGLWDEKFKEVPDKLLPSSEVTMDMLNNGFSGVLAEADVDKTIANSFKKAQDSLFKLEKTGMSEWYKAKNTTIAHLLKLPAFGYDYRKIGGWGNTVNAVTDNHGPSWRMVVEMGEEISAWGVYPGGQSGNPGSKYYATFMDSWTAGRYHKLLLLPANTANAPNQIKYSITVYP